MHGLLCIVYSLPPYDIAPSALYLIHTRNNLELQTPSRRDSGRAASMAPSLFDRGLRQPLVPPNFHFYLRETSSCLFKQTNVLICVLIQPNRRPCCALFSLNPPFYRIAGARVLLCHREAETFPACGTIAVAAPERIACLISESTTLFSFSLGISASCYQSS